MGEGSLSALTSRYQKRPTHVANMIIAQRAKGKAKKARGVSVIACPGSMGPPPVGNAPRVLLLPVLTAHDPCEIFHAVPWGPPSPHPTPPTTLGFCVRTLTVTHPTANVRRLPRLI